MTNSKSIWLLLTIIIIMDSTPTGVGPYMSPINFTDMPPGTDCPYPIRILAFFEMIRPYHIVIRI